LLIVGDSNAGNENLPLKRKEGRLSFGGHITLCAGRLTLMACELSKGKSSTFCLRSNLSRPSGGEFHYDTRDPLTSHRLLILTARCVTP